MKKAAIIVVIAFVMAIAGKTAVYRLFPLEYAEYIEKYAKEYSLSKYLVMGTIYAESGFDSKAQSKVAKGLMQVTPETAQWVAERLKIEVSDIEEPETNIQIGCYYLSYLIGKYGETDTAIAAYNAGHGRVSSWLVDEKCSKDGVTLAKIPYSETEEYVKRVRGYRNIYRKLYK